MPVKRALVSDQVFGLLSGQILSGDYAPGELLPTQRALAADLGVNMASVREAVKRLEQLRLVEARQGEGMRVRDWRRDGGLDVIAHLLLGAGTLDASALAAVLEARTLMLREAARLAAERRSAGQAEALESIAAAIAQGGDAKELQLLDLAFMTELVDAAGNLVFVLILNTVRRLYLDSAEMFEAVIAEPAELAPFYARAARAIAAGAATSAANSIERLASAQERALLEAVARR